MNASRRIVPALAAAALLLAACGGGQAATNAPSAAPTEAATTTPTVAPTATPAPTLAPLGALTQRWQTGGPVTVANMGTYWPAVDPKTGDIWVSASQQNQFWIFSPAGKFLEAWGTAGTGPGQFHLATNDPNPDAAGAIAFAPDGSFYVVDNGNYRIEKFDAKRKFVLAWGSFGTGDGQFGSPKGIATDGTTVWVADDARGDMQAFDTSGHFKGKFPFPFVLFSRTPDGHFLITGCSSVGVFDVTGAYTTIPFDVPGYCGPASRDGGFGMTVMDANGHIWVTMQDDSGPVGLVEIDRTGKVLGTWSNGSETLALSPDGKTLYQAYWGPPAGWPFLRAIALP